MNKTTFFSAFNRPKTTESEIGSPEATTYEYRIDKVTGRKVSVPNGKTNVYEKIQASLEGCKLENIIKRAGNEPELLKKSNGQYIDISEAPKTILEAQDMILRIRNEFDGLPIEKKNLFENDVVRYVSKYGTDEWAKKMGLIETTTITEPVTPVTPVATEGVTND